MSPTPTLEQTAFDDLDEIGDEVQRALRAFERDDAGELYDALIQIKSVSTSWSIPEADK